MSRSCNILSHRSYLDLNRICTDEKALETVRCGLYFGPMDDVSEKFPAVHDRLKVRFAGPTKYAGDDAPIELYLDGQPVKCSRNSGDVEVWLSGERCPALSKAVCVRLKEEKAESIIF